MLSFPPRLGDSLAGELILYARYALLQEPEHAKEGALQHLENAASCLQ